MSKDLPLSPERIIGLTKEFETPFHIYDEAGIRSRAQALNRAFDWVEGPNGEAYMNHYAVKANANPHILEVVADEGMGADTSSGPEVTLAAAVGLTGSEIMFTANHAKHDEYRKAHANGAVINLDDVDHTDELSIALSDDFPDTISFRYNMGDKKVGGVNDIIGTPEDSKFGVPGWALEIGYRTALDRGVQHLGMHAMVASNELDAAHHVATARLVFEKIAELSHTLGVPFEFANLGGGLGIPYRPDDSPLDYSQLRKVFTRPTKS